jgi:hypothetical protein
MNAPQIHNPEELKEALSGEIRPPDVAMICAMAFTTRRDPVVQIKSQVWMQPIGPQMMSM